MGNTTVTIDVIKKDRTAFKDTNGTWWNTKFNPLPPNFQKGMTVSFMFKDGTTFVNGGVNAAGGASMAAPTQQSSQPAQSFGVSKDVMIVRQNALSHASRMLTSQQSWDEVPYEEMSELCIKIAEDLADWVVGERDKKVLDELSTGDPDPSFG